MPFYIIIIRHIHTAVLHFSYTSTSSVHFIVIVDMVVVVIVAARCAGSRALLHWQLAVQSFKLFLYYFIAIMKTWYRLFMCALAAQENNEKNEGKAKGKKVQKN